MATANSVDDMELGTSIVPVDAIVSRILLFRGQRIMLSDDLAELYGVQVRQLTQAVRRNPDRFPEDFMFQLDGDEFESLIQQDSAARWGGRRHAPLAFTEEGVAMLSSVLRSQRAVQVNVEIMRAFVRLRRMISEHADLVARLDALEAKYDQQFAQVFQAIRQLMAPPLPGDKHAYGFTGAEGEKTPRQPKARARKSAAKPNVVQKSE